MKKLIFVFIIIIIGNHLILINRCFSQIPGSPLHVSERQIRDANNNLFIIKGINLNDYMECSYKPWGKWFRQSFPMVLSWLHTQDDYHRIKRMGFNTVRVNICPAHIDSIPNLQRIKEHIRWAKADSLYVILAYFAPPGSDTCKGYYSEWNFYLSQYYQNIYKQHWGEIMKLCKDSSYSHVMYEFLNEPQIAYGVAQYPTYNEYKTRSVYKDLMNGLLDTLNSTYNNDGNRIVIIDGLSFAKADYRGFNYLNKTLNHHNKFNLVYSFHYYMEDFAFRKCNWNIGNLYKNYTGYIDTNQGWDTIQFNFTLSDLQGEINPDISLSTYDQRGTNRIRYFEIRENTNIVKISLDLLNKQIIEEGSSRYILDASTGRKYDLCYHGNCGSAANSNMYISNNNSLAIRNTVKQDTDSSLGNSNWAVLTYSNASGNYPFNLNSTATYTFKIIMDGDSLGDNGGFTIGLKQNGIPNVFRLKKDVRNLTWGNTYDIEKILTSHTDRINAAFEIMNNISDTFNVPIFLGEFGIPIVTKEPNTYTYFRKIMNNINQYGFSWAYFDYRQPDENYKLPDTDNYITFGLFSGRDTAYSQTATVCKVVNGIGSIPQLTSYTLGPPYQYYYNKSLIDTLTRILNGYFSPVCSMTGLEYINERIPSIFYLNQNYPNPFNPKTKIRFGIPSSLKNEKQITSITIYDVLGREVAVLMNDYLQPGNYEVSFDGNNLASGIYFYTLKAGGFIESKKMLLIK